MKTLETFLLWLRARIAYAGTNVQFLANVGHFTVPWFVTSILYRFGWAHHGRWWVLGLTVAYAAGKEYYFDARYEVPHQTFGDNTEDFLGYVAGAALAALVFA